MQQIFLFAFTPFYDIIKPYVNYRCYGKQVHSIVECGTKDAFFRGSKCSIL